MGVKDKMFHPGQILHEVIEGALKSRQGITFSKWCKENDMNYSTMRNVTHGITSGPVGQAELDKIIDDAGRDVVLTLYLSRLRSDISNLERRVEE